MSQYEKVTPELIQALQAAVPGRVSVDGDINDDFSHDEMPIYLSLIHISEPTRH